MKSLEDMNIYIVDDDSRSIQLIEAILKKKGYRKIKGFTSSTEGFDMTQKAPPDLLILDIIMPKMNGFEFCKLFRTSEITSAIPVIMITGGAINYDDALKNSFEFGFMDFIRKPVESLELAVRVKSSLELKRIHDCMQEELNNFRQSEKTRVRLLTAIEQSDETIVITDENGQIQYINPAFEHITGYSKEEVIGQNPRILKSNKQNKKFYRNMWDTLSRGEVWQGRLINKKKDNSFYNEEANISPVINSQGKIVNYVAVKRDITETLKTEAQVHQLQKMQAIGVLAGGIAHDFNNILAIITANSEMALEDVPENSEPHYSLQQILQAALRAKNLVQQIFVFSRRTDTELIPLSLSPLIKESIKFLKSTKPKNIEILHNLKADSGSVFCEPNQIHQILMNLSTNALCAMGADNGTLKISLDELTLSTNDIPDLDPGSYLKLSVSDTGHGISPENLGKIFDPYFTDKAVNEASGLGLSVCHGIVNSLKGKITAESTVGKGSVFSIFLPRAETDMPEQIETNKTIQMGKECILLVDDEKMLAKVTGRSLERLGYEAVIKTDPEEALKTFESQPDKFDLIITDKNMPKMNGLELTAKIKQISSVTPVIMCTGLSEDSNSEGMNYPEISGVINKPVSRKAMGDTIRKILDEKEKTAAV